MHLKTICVITIGQTPRTDMIPPLRSYLPNDTRIIEKGVLDSLVIEEIQHLFVEEGQTTLVSRLTNGNSVVVSKEKIIPIIQQLIDECQKSEIDLILLACTGKFPLFSSEIPVIYPDFLLNYAVKGLLREGELGVIVPLIEQSEMIQDKWKEVNFKTCITSTSPYNGTHEELVQATKRLNESQVQAILLDCMGYSNEMKNIIREHTTKPIIVARNIIYANLAELL
ncbi:AroM family protein [Psychrobacillus soli]|nr:AroM family protein [Psychrobacillus soli]